MEYALFKGFQRVGTLFPSVEEAEKMIDSKGIWNICTVAVFTGKMHIVGRRTVVK